MAKNDVKDLSKSVAIERTYKVSVQDMINSARKCNDEFGIEGYENASLKYNSYLDKPTIFSVSKDKNPRDYISMI